MAETNVSHLLNLNFVDTTEKFKYASIYRIETSKYEAANYLHIQQLASILNRNILLQQKEETVQNQPIVLNIRISFHEGEYTHNFGNGMFGKIYCRKLLFQIFLFLLLPLSYINDIGSSSY